MPAGPELSTTLSDLLFEKKDVLKKNYIASNVLASKYQRVHPSRDEFDGSSVRFAFKRNIKQGTAAATESGTLVGPRNIRTLKGTVNLGLISHIIQLSPRLMKVSDNMAVSFAKALDLELEMAEEAMKSVFNDALNGPGDGKLHDIAANVAASGGATQTINVGTAANFFRLHLGRVVDVLVKTTLARVAGHTQSVRITDVNEATGVITVVNDDGSATSFATTAATDGIYIEGVVGQTAGSTSVPAGLEQATVQTGTFEAIDRAANADFKAVDGRAGDASAADLSISIMDGCIRRRGRNAQPENQLWVAEPAVLDKFSQSLLTQSRWAGDAGKLEVGFDYLDYRNERLYPEYAAKTGRITNVPLDDITFYATMDGPDWDELDGNKLKRFARSLPAEAWLIDEVQVAYRRLNSIVFADNLNAAA